MWDLRQPSKLVECFYFLCNLKVQIDEDFDKDMEAMRARTGEDIVNWGILEARTNNWDASRDGAGNGTSGGAGGNVRDNESGDISGGQAGDTGRDGRMKDDADEISANSATREDGRSEDEMSTSSDASSEPITRDTEEANRWYASIASWRAGKKYPVYDMEEFRKDTSIPML